MELLGEEGKGLKKRKEEAVLLTNINASWRAQCSEKREKGREEKKEEETKSQSPPTPATTTAATTTTTTATAATEAGPLRGRGGGRERNFYGRERRDRKGRGEKKKKHSHFENIERKK